jgi:hypothetical protein
MWLAGVAAVPVGIAIGGISACLFLFTVSGMNIYGAIILALPQAFPFHCLGIFICFKAIKKVITILTNIAGGGYVDSADTLFNIVILLISSFVAIPVVTAIGIKLDNFVQDHTDLKVDSSKPVSRFVPVCQVIGAISCGLISLSQGTIPFADLGETLVLRPSVKALISVCVGTWAGMIVGSFLGTIICIPSILRKAIYDAKWSKLPKKAQSVLSVMAISATTWFVLEVFGAFVEWVVQGLLNKAFPWFK